MQPSLAWVIGVGGAIGGAHLLAHYGSAPRLTAVTKAAPILLLLCWVATLDAVVGGAYRWLVAAGLACSAAGDLLLLSAARFRAGLAAFFVAHVLYLVAFAGASPALAPAWSWAALLALFAAAMLVVLWPHVAAERLPVAGYVAMISLMAWAAMARARAPATPHPSAGLAAAGAVAFMLSDSVLALDRFVRPWRGAHAVVMVTYYLAQTLIAASVAA